MTNPSSWSLSDSPSVGLVPLLPARESSLLSRVMRVDWAPPGESRVFFSLLKCEP